MSVLGGGTVPVLCIFHPRPSFCRVPGPPAQVHGKRLQGQGGADCDTLQAWRTHPLSRKSGLLAAFVACSLLVSGSAPATLALQEGKQEGMQQSQGGMANAGPQKAEFDSQHRPITAGGFVKTGPIVFQDTAAAAGLTRWHHTAGTPEKRLILEAKGPGVCLLDYDNDGWLDI